MDKRIVTAVAFLFLGLLGLTSCSKELPELKVDPAWSGYVSQHTSGLVSKKVQLHVRFNSDVAPAELIGKPLSDGIEMSPTIKIDASFAGPRELLIIPKTPLQPGQTYRVVLNPKCLMGVPESIGPFVFQISVLQRDYEIVGTGLEQDASDVIRMVLHGLLNTADVEEGEVVEKLLKATYLDSELPLNWEHSADGRRHEFSVAGIQRQAQSGMLQLIWNGSALGVATSGNRSIEIPALGVFRVTGIRSVISGGRYIEVTFSDPVDARQNLVGLLRLSSGEFTTRLEGNTVRLYPSTIEPGEVRVSVEGAVRSSAGKGLGERFEGTVVLEEEKPKVRFVDSGVILPDNDRLTIPFEAVNVHSVQVTAFRVFENNLGQFLQNNSLSGKTELPRVGRYLWRKTIPLQAVSRGKWNRFALDASDLLRENPGGLFRLTLSINRGNSTYTCSAEENRIPVTPDASLQNHEDLQVVETSSWDNAENWNEDGQSGAQGNWRERENPCADGYFSLNEGVSDTRNFMASNIGLLAKRGTDDKLHLVATNLRTGKPLEGVTLTVFNFQNQPLLSGKTDAQGMLRLVIKETPFYLVAEKENQKGYLKLSTGNALMVSHFDVGGQSVEKGVKGVLYGERGVWRPGDDIFLTFVLQDKEGIIPVGHPVTVELFNPHGQMTQSLTNAAPLSGFYTFQLKTEEKDPTGNWLVKAHLGGMTVEKTLKIETVVPNRLKVDLDFGDEVLYAERNPLKGSISSQWLHGAVADKLKAEVAVQLKSRPTGFGRHGDFVFDDPTRKFTGEKQILFNDHLDDKGHARFEQSIVAEGNAPGMLDAFFTSRVFEEGGGFSINTRSVPFHPYRSYVGIKLPKGDAARNMLLTDISHKVEIATLSAKGEPVSLEKIEVTLYKIDWKWWWDQSGDSLAHYSSSNHNTALKQGVVATRGGKGSWEFEIKYPDWGRYLLRACDAEGKHCTAKVFYCDWPGWAGRAREERGPGASSMTLFSDKKTYVVGETATITLPPATQGRALISIENGSGVLEQRWLELAAGQVSFPLPVTKAMSPNVYVHVTVVQPHAGKTNDRPIRLYGIVPLGVEDPETRLKPVIDVATEVRPESTMPIAVREARGAPMTYTLAVVDEGLLGLTNYKAPDLHGDFYRKEALGVKTWDLFDEVVGAYGGELERILALGGDEESGARERASSTRRFPPLVKFLGPFQLKKGGVGHHSIVLPQYVGMARVMVVTGQQGAYGTTEKSVLVRQPLTILPTLPRVLGPDEEIEVPVSLFVMDQGIREVALSMTADDLFEVVDGQTKVMFAQPGDKLGRLRLKVKPRTGRGEIRFKAVSGVHVATAKINIEVRSPNPRTVRQQKTAIEPGKSWTTTIVPHGLAGTNRFNLEASVIPPLNLERRLDYLIQYPHGCIEQTTSSVFPQLFLPTLTTLEPQLRKRLDDNINAGIERLRLFQRPDGGFSYWPGDPAANSWGTNYAGHFLLEAKRLGYAVPAQQLSDWQGYQKAAAQAWTTGSDLDQAYRLFTLALAGSPELGAMNRLRETGGLSNVARWQLAAAYRLLGLTDAASELVTNADLAVSGDNHSELTYGSDVRDRAIVLVALVLLDDKLRAKDVADRISKVLASEQWLSTQSTAYALLAMARMVGSDGSSEAFRYSWRSGDNKEQTVASDKPISQVALPNIPAAGSELRVANPGQSTLFVTLTAEGVPRAGDETAASQGLSLTVHFTGKDGKELEIRQLPQGTDLRATVEVRNLTERNLTNLALTQTIPSGWQILNGRFEGGSVEGGIDYQDIRDDRIFTYFGLRSGETKTFTAQFNASFLGRNYLPGWSVEAMYDVGKHARTVGGWVEVVPANGTRRSGAGATR